MPTSKKAGSAPPLLKKVDHVAYAILPDNRRKWLWFFTEVLKGRLVVCFDDVQPDNEKSSMSLDQINFDDFGIALIAGINRKEKSQVTLFAECHGDLSVQHVAYDVGDFNSFYEHVRSFGMSFRGDMLERHDEMFNTDIKQIFTKGHIPGESPAESSFTEFLQRISMGLDPEPNKKITFSGKIANSLYKQIETAQDNNDCSPMIDFSSMPDNWKPKITPLANTKEEL